MREISLIVAVTTLALAALPLSNAGCDDLPAILSPPTGVEDTFIRSGFGEWHAPRPATNSKHQGADVLVRRSFDDKQRYAVHAIANGKVAYARVNGGIDAGWGNTIVIDHGNGCYSMYAHIAQTPANEKNDLSKLLVSVGDTVDGGQIVGYMVDPDAGVASTGNARYTNLIARHQLHFSLIEADPNLSGAGSLRDAFFQKPNARYVDPTGVLVRVGLEIEAADE